MIARGLRNHNPGNIKASRIDWEGEIHPGNEKTFTVFKAPWWGIRAMAKLLLNYQRKRHLKTVEAIIGRYAPKGGHDKNNTSEYAFFVARAMGLTPGQEFEFNYFYLAEMTRAMVYFENGSCPYTWEVPTALIMAGMEPAPTIVEPGRLSYKFKED